jgi:hypothetical protein
LPFRDALLGPAFFYAAAVNIIWFFQCAALWVGRVARFSGDSNTAPTFAALGMPDTGKPEATAADQAWAIKSVMQCFCLSCRYIHR